MMRFLIIIIVFAGALQAAFEFSSVSGFTNGFSNSSLAYPEHYSAFMLNPALSNSQSLSAGLHYFKPYNLSGLNFGGITAVIPNKNWNWGINLSVLGASVYQENRVTLNVSRDFLSNKFSAGLNLHWYGITVDQYGNANSLGVDIGFSYYISRYLSTGFSVQNFNQPKLNGYSDEIPVITSWGAAFTIDEHFRAHIALKKDSWYPANILFGVVFRANDFIAIESGFNTYPATPSLGIRFRQSLIVVNYAFQYHSDLGITHFWGISFTKPVTSK